jgi:hypothetical protein
LIDFARNNDDKYLCENKKFSITHRSNSTRLPTPAQLAELKLHVQKIDTIHLDKLTSLMSSDKQVRFNHLFELLTTPNMEPSEHMPASTLLTRHAQHLVDCCVAERATPEPTRGAGIPFVVVETKADEHGGLFERLRFIFWPKRHNEFLKRSGYECKVDLKHISAYLDRILTECGAVADVACGFFQIAIPEHARAWFRFQDADGNTFQMTRLPMGISIAVEIMQLTTETVAGSPKTCAPQHVIPNVIQHVWIDDVRITGQQHKVEIAIDRIEERARYVRMTLKHHVRGEQWLAATEYDFLGVRWDHNGKTVTLGRKTLSKLPQSIGSTMTAGAIEGLIARLIYAAGVLRIPLVQYHWALKWCTRLCNKLNRGYHDPDTLLSVPDCVRKELQRWLIAAKTAKIIDRITCRGTAVLFTDASLLGWGAILIDDAGRVLVQGAAWPTVQTESGDISKLEADAARLAINKFQDVILRLRSLELRVDNTSVLSAFRRGIARAESINIALRGVITWLAEHSVILTVSYVKSAENPADPISRGMPHSTSAVDSALRDEFRGGGGVPWRATPSQNIFDRTFAEL